MKIDIYEHGPRLERQLELIKQSPIPLSNKKLLNEFKNDSTSGWGGTKPGKPRII